MYALRWSGTNRLVSAFHADGEIEYTTDVANARRWGLSQGLLADLQRHCSQRGPGYGPFFNTALEIVEIETVPVIPWRVVRTL